MWRPTYQCDGSIRWGPALFLQQAVYETHLSTDGNMAFFTSPWMNATYHAYRDLSLTSSQHIYFLAESFFMKSEDIRNRKKLWQVGYYLYVGVRGRPSVTAPFSPWPETVALRSFQEWTNPQMFYSKPWSKLFFLSISVSNRLSLRIVLPFLVLICMSEPG